MKKILVILSVIFSVIIVGCNITAEENMDADFLEKAKGHKLYNFNLGIVDIQDDLDERVDKLSIWISENTRYVSDEKGYDIWSDPKVTVDRGYGDCDDFAILLMDLIYYEMNMVSNFVAVDANKVSLRDPDQVKYMSQSVINIIDASNIRNDAIVGGGIPNHVLVELCGRLYDGRCGRVYCDSIEFRYQFHEVF
jgi:hypothetical protein